MLERIISADMVSKKPGCIFFLGILYASFALLVSIIIFPSEPSIATVFLLTILCIPLLHRFIVKSEEEEIENLYKKRFVLLRHHLKFLFSKTVTAHSKVILIFIVMFIAFIICFATWYVLLPKDISEPLFSSQRRAISAVNIAIHGKATSSDVFTLILLNNLRVLAFSFVLSFLFGAGAIFVLAWNSSVISVAIGELLIKNAKNFTVLTALSSFGRYLIHGIPEIAGYFIATMSGLFISVGVIRYNLRSKEFRRLLIASVDLILLSLIVLVFAAVIEVSVSPFVAA